MSRDETTRSVELLERRIAMLTDEEVRIDGRPRGGKREVIEEMRQRWLELLRKEAAQ